MGQSASTCKRDIEAWLIARGVPRFVDEYSIKHRLPDLVAPLSVVGAAQITAIALFSLDTWQIALTPAVVTILAIPVLPAVRAVLDPRSPSLGLTPTESLARALPLLVGSGIALLLLPRRDRPQWELCVDAFVVLGAVLATRILLAPEIWTCDARSLARMRVALFAFATSAVVLFALEGSPVEPFTPQTLGVLPPSLPQALPALPFIAVVWLLAWTLARRAYQPNEDEDEPGPAGGRPSNLLGLSPLLVLVLGLETGILPGTVPTVLAAVLPLALLIAIVIVSLRLSGGQAPDWTARQLKESASRLKPPERSRDGVIWLVVPAYLLGFPILAAVSHQENFVVSLAINAAYLAMAWFFVSYGLDRVAVWAFEKLRTNRNQLMRALARSVPLLLIFATFFILTTELWQSVEAMGSHAYYGLLSGLVGVIIVFILISLQRDLDRDRTFGTWSEVSRGARRVKAPDHEYADLDERIRTMLEEAGLLKPGGDHATPTTMNATHAPVRALLEEANLTAEGKPEDWPDKPKLKLTVSQEINVLAVLLVYQALVFVPLVIAAFGTFLLVGRLAVPDDLLKNWIYGDNAVPSDYSSFLARSFLAEPWTQVAAFLAVFSLLYFAVSVLGNEQWRREYFAEADEGMRQRLAVRIVYERQLRVWRALSPDEHVPKPSRLKRARSRAARVTPRSRTPR
jgi:hypothetical protein